MAYINNHSKASFYKQKRTVDKWKDDLQKVLKQWRNDQAVLAKLYNGSLTIPKVEQGALILTHCTHTRG